MSTSTNQQTEQLALDLAIEAEIKPHYWVNQSNILINARQDLNLTERRIIYSLISLVQPDDEDFKTYTIQIKELANLIGIADSSFYKRVEDAVDRLQSKVFIVEGTTQKNNKKIVSKINWIQQATYIRGEGLLRIKLSDALAEFLMNLKRDYTGYQLFNVLRLRSDYSWRVYELLKEREYWNKRVIKVSELREKLNIPDDKLTLMKNFRAVVLDKAKEEIEEKTDIRFNYEVYKRVGRRIDSFVFYISDNHRNIEESLTEEAMDYNIKRLYNRLVVNGVRPAKASQIVKKYQPRYIEDNIRYAMKGNEDITNLAGYIVKAIEHNYADSSTNNIDKEDSLFRIVVESYDNKIKALNKKDIASLESIYDYFIKLHKEKLTSLELEDIDFISKERETRFFEKINEIQNTRRESNVPLLTLYDVEGSKVKPFLKMWYEKEKEEIPY